MGQYIDMITIILKYAGLENGSEKT